MTVLWALLALAGPVVEVLELGAGETTLQAIVRLGPTTSRERQALRVVALSMPLQTDDYLRRDMMQITDGRPVQVSLLPDCVRVSVTVPAGETKSGAGLLESLLRRATLRQEDLDAGVASARAKTQADWALVLEPDRPDMTRLDRSQARELYRRTFRADRTFLSVGGVFVPGEAGQEWSSRTEVWRDPRQTAPGRASEPIEATPGPGDALVFEGATFGAGDVNIAGRLLTLVALGSGKGSALHRVWREAKGWSYRQEAVLWPVADGWRPRLVASMAGMGPERPSEARQALLEDIAAWTEADRARALGMAQGVFLNEVPFSPLYLTPDGAPATDLQGRTFLAGYWRMKTGTAWAPERLVASMAFISLAELKQSAKDLVSDSSVRP